MSHSENIMVALQPTWLPSNSWNFERCLEGGPECGRCDRPKLART
jgi:hypothetical protein